MILDPIMGSKMLEVVIKREENCVIVNSIFDGWNSHLCEMVNAPSGHSLKRVRLEVGRALWEGETLVRFQHLLRKRGIKPRFGPPGASSFSFAYFSLKEKIKERTSFYFRSGNKKNVFLYFYFQRKIAKKKELALSLFGAQATPGQQKAMGSPAPAR